jgi:hypothetical protein
MMTLNQILDMLGVSTSTHDGDSYISDPTSYTRQTHGEHPYVMRIMGSREVEDRGRLFVQCSGDVMLSIEPVRKSPTLPSWKNHCGHPGCTDSYTCHAPVFYLVRDEHTFSHGKSPVVKLVRPA